MASACETPSGSAADRATRSTPRSSSARRSRIPRPCSRRWPNRRADSARSRTGSSEVHRYSRKKDAEVYGEATVIPATDESGSFCRVPPTAVARDVAVLPTSTHAGDEGADVTRAFRRLGLQQEVRAFDVDDDAVARERPEFLRMTAADE